MHDGQIGGKGAFSRQRDVREASEKRNAGSDSGGPRVPWTTMGHATNAVHGSPVEPTANEVASANSSSAAREGEKMKQRSFLSHAFFSAPDRFPSSS